jgi:small subunit ribosomal protein S16
VVKIRLKRMGTTKRPFYRLVVADARSPRDGRFIEALGYYDPLPQPAAVRIDADRVREWLSRGARPSDSARDLLVAQGIIAGDPRRRAVPAGAPVVAGATAVEAEPEPEPVVAPAGSGGAVPADEAAEAAQDGGGGAAVAEESA